MNESPVARQIEALQADYEALVESARQREWRQCSEILSRCRDGYGRLFGNSPDSLRHYVVELQQLQRINRQTLDYVDTLRREKAKELAQLRRGRQVMAQYSDCQTT